MAADKPVLLPSAQHPITVTPTAARVTATVAGRPLADTTGALALAEADYPVVQYVPRADVDAALLRPSDHTSYCPFKGDASYFDLVVGEQVFENAVWTYEQPYDAVAEIAGRLAFYPDKVSVTVEG